MTDPIEDVKTAAASGDAAAGEVLARATASLHDRLAALEAQAKTFVTRAEHQAATDALLAKMEAKTLIARAWAWLHTTPGLIAAVVLVVILTSWANDGGLIAYVGF